MGELVEHGPVGGRDVGRITRQGHPAERPLALAEQRPDVGGQEARVVEGPLAAPQEGLGPQAVAVVEHLGSGVEEADHGLHMGGHGGSGPADELLGLAPAQLVGGCRRQIVGNVGEGIVGGCLVGHDVGCHAVGQQAGQGVGRVGDQSHRQRPPGCARLGAAAQRIGVAVGDHIEIAGLHAASGPLAVDLDAKGHPSVHGDGQGLGAAHPAQSGRHGEGSRQRSAESLAGDGREALVGALQDPLGADVDPRARRHLPEHGQPEPLQPPELVPRRPFTDEVGVGYEDPGSPLMGSHHADRLARLHQQGLVAGQVGQRPDHRVVGVPGTGGPARAAVHHEIVGALGHIGVEVVLEHPEGSFLGPPAARQRGARRSPHAPGGSAPSGMCSGRHR